MKCSTLVFHHLHDAQFVLCNLQPDLIHHFGILRFDFSVRDCHLLLRQGLSTFFHHNDEPYPTPAQAWHQAWHRVQGLPLLRRIELVLPAGLTTSIPNGEALHNNMIAAAAQLTRQPEEGPFMEQARMTDMVMRILSGLNMERVEHEMSFYEPLPRYFESVDDVLAEYMGGSYLDVD